MPDLLSVCGFFSNFISTDNVLAPETMAISVKIVKIVHLVYAAGVQLSQFGLI